VSTSWDGTGLMDQRGSYSDDDLVHHHHHDDDDDGDGGGGGGGGYDDDDDDDDDDDFGGTEGERSLERRSEVANIDLVRGWRT